MLRGRRVRLFFFLAASAALLWLTLALLTEDAATAGRAALAAGEYRRAAALLSRAVSRSPGDPELHRQLGEAFERLERYEAAARAYLRALELQPARRELLLAVGRCLVEGGVRDKPPCREAEAFARSIYDDQHFEGPYLLGLSLHRRYRLERETLRKELRRTFQGPFLGAVLWHLDATLNAKDFATALKRLRAELKRLVELPETSELYGRLEALEGLRHEAETALRAAARRPGHGGWPLLELGRLALARSHFEEARRRARALLDARETAPAVQVWAHRLAARALEGLAPEDPARLRAARAHWGFFLAGLGQLPFGHRLHDLARYEALNRRGELAVKLQDPRALEDVAAAFLGDDPNHPRGLYFRGMARYFAGRHKEAEYDLQQAVAAEPQNVIAHLTLGRILLQRGDPYSREGARLHFRRAASLAPHKVEPVLALIQVHRRDGDLNEAYRLVTDALARGLGGAAAVDRLEAVREELEVALLKEDPDTSYREPAAARAALARHPRDLYALYWLATHAWARGRLQEAEGYARKLYRYAPRDFLRPRLLLARILLAQGRLEDPLLTRLLYEARKKAPQDARPVYLLAQWHRRRGEGKAYWDLLCRAAQLEPFHRPYQVELAERHLEGGGYRYARYHLDRALEKLAPVPPAWRLLDLRLRLAEARAARGEARRRALARAAQAVAELVAAGKLGEAQAAAYRARLAALEGDLNRALRWYEKAAAQAKDPGPYVWAAAQIELQEGLRDQALARLRAFRKRGGRHREVHRFLARHYLSRWDFRQAMEEFGLLAGAGDGAGTAGWALCRLYLGDTRSASQALPWRHEVWYRATYGAEAARDMLLASAYALLAEEHWSTALHLLQKLAPAGSPAPRGLVAYFAHDLEAARAAAAAARPGEKEQDPFLRFLRGLLRLRDGAATGVMTDLLALVPEAPRPPDWVGLARAAAQRRPGFGRWIVRGAVEVLLRRGEPALAREVLRRVGRQAFPTDRALAWLDSLARWLAGAQGAEVPFVPAEDADEPTELRDRGILQILAHRPEGLRWLARYARFVPAQGGRLVTWARTVVGGEELPRALAVFREAVPWRFSLEDRVLRVALLFLLAGPEAAQGEAETAPKPLRTLLLHLAAAMPQGGDDALPAVALWRALARGLALRDVPRFRALARRALEEALAADPGHPLLRFLAAWMALRAGDLEAGRAHALQVGDPVLQALARARWARLAGRLGEARRLAAEARRAAPALAEAWLEEALAGPEAWAPWEARLAAARAAHSTLEDPRLWDLLARRAEAAGQLETGYASRVRALVLSGDDEARAAALMRRLLDHRRYPEAIALWLRFPGLFERVPSLRFRLGVLLAELGRYRAARAELARFPHRPEALYWLGKIEQAQENLAGAVAAWRRAFALDPQGEVRAVRLAVAALKKAFRLRDALDLAREWVARHPRSAEAWEALGDVTQRLYRRDEALLSWVQAWLLDPQNPAPLLSLIRLYRERREYAVARTLLQLVEAHADRLPPALRRTLEQERLQLKR